MSKLAVLTSSFILIVVIYSFITGEPLYKLKFFVYKMAVVVSIISIGIHLNALFQDKAQKGLLKLSLFVPSAVIMYFTIGVILWFRSGT